MKIRYTGNTSVGVEGHQRFETGAIIARGEIPDDAFEYLSSREDFEEVPEPTLDSVDFQEEIDHGHR